MPFLHLSRIKGMLRCWLKDRSLAFSLFLAAGPFFPRLVLHASHHTLYPTATENIETSIPLFFIRMLKFLNANSNTTVSLPDIIVGRISVNFKRSNPFSCYKTLCDTKIFCLDIILHCQFFSNFIYNQCFISHYAQSIRNICHS